MSEERRVIEQREATKLELMATKQELKITKQELRDFQQKVSDAMERFNKGKALAEALEKLVTKKKRKRKW